MGDNESKIITVADDLVKEESVVQDDAIDRKDEAEGGKFPFVETDIFREKLGLKPEKEDKNNPDKFRNNEFIARELKSIAKEIQNSRLEEIISALFRMEENLYDKWEELGKKIKDKEQRFTQMTEFIQRKLYLMPKEILLAKIVVWSMVGIASQMRDHIIELLRLGNHLKGAQPRDKGHSKIYFGE